MWKYVGDFFWGTQFAFPKLHAFCTRLKKSGALEDIEGRPSVISTWRRRLTVGKHLQVNFTQCDAFVFDSLWFDPLILHCICRATAATWQCSGDGHLLLNNDNNNNNVSNQLQCQIWLNTALRWEPTKMNDFIYFATTFIIPTGVN